MKDPGSYANPINSSFQTFRTTSRVVTPIPAAADSESVQHNRIANFRETMESPDLSPAENLLIFHVSRSDPLSPTIHYVLLPGDGDFTKRPCDTVSDSPGLNICFSTTFTNYAKHTMVDANAECSIERIFDTASIRHGDIVSGETVSWDWQVLVTERSVGKVYYNLSWKLE